VGTTHFRLPQSMAMTGFQGADIDIKTRRISTNGQLFALPLERIIQKLSNSLKKGTQL
jgi:hypothetical protein